MYKKMFVTVIDEDGHALVAKVSEEVLDSFNKAGETGEPTADLTFEEWTQLTFEDYLQYVMDGVTTWESSKS